MEVTVNGRTGPPSWFEWSGKYLWNRLNGQAHLANVHSASLCGRIHSRNKDISGPKQAHFPGDVVCAECVGVKEVHDEHP